MITKKTSLNNSVRSMSKSKNTSIRENSAPNNYPISSQSYRSRMNSYERQLKLDPDRNINIQMKINNINFKNRLHTIVDLQDRASIPPEKSLDLSDLKIIKKERNKDKDYQFEDSFNDHRNQYLSEENIGGVIDKIKNELGHITRHIKTTESINSFKTPSIKLNTTSSSNQILETLRNKNKNLEKELNTLRNKFLDIKLDKHNDFKKVQMYSENTYEIEPETDNYVKDESEKHNGKYQAIIEELRQVIKIKSKENNQLENKLNTLLPSDLNQKDYIITHVYSTDCEKFYLTSKKEGRRFFLPENEFIEKDFNLQLCDNLINLNDLENDFQSLQSHNIQIESDLNELKQNLVNQLSLKEQQLAAAKEEIETFKMKSVETFETIGKLEEFKQQYHTIKKENLSLISEINEKNRLLIDCEAKFKLINEKLEFYVQEYNNIKISNENFIREKESLSTRLSEKEKEIKIIEKKFKSQITDYIKSMEEDKKLISDLEKEKTKIDEISNKYEKLLKDSQLKDLIYQEEKQEKDRIISSLHNQIDNIPNIINEELSKYKLSLGDINKDINHNKTELTQMKEKLDYAVEDKKFLETKISKLVEKNTHLDEKNMELLRNIVDYDSKLSEIQTKLTEKEESLYKLKTSNEVLSKSLEKSNNSQEDLKTKYKNEFDNLEYQIKEKNLLISELSQKIEVLESNKCDNIMNIENESYNKKEALIINRVESLNFVGEKSSHNLNNNNSITNKTPPHEIILSEDYKGRYEEAIQTNEKLNAEIKKLNTSFNSITRENKTLNHNISEIMKNAKITKENYESDFKNLKQKHEDNTKSLKNEIDDLQQKIKSLNETNEDYKDQIENLKSAKYDIDKNNKNIENNQIIEYMDSNTSNNNINIDQLNEELSNYKKELEVLSISLTQEKIKSEEVVKSSQLTISSLEKSHINTITQIKKENDELKKEINSSHDQIKEIKLNHESEIKQINHLKQKLTDSFKEKTDDYESTLTNLKTNLNDSFKECENIKNELDKKSTHIKSLESEIRNLKSDLEEKNLLIKSHLKTIDSQNQTRQNELSLLNEKEKTIADLEEQLNKLFKKAKSFGILDIHSFNSNWLSTKQNCDDELQMKLIEIEIIKEELEKKEEEVLRSKEEIINLKLKLQEYLYLI